jgi:hypothetical protein
MDPAECISDMKDLSRWRRSERTVTEILSPAFGGTNLARGHFFQEAVTRRSTRRLSRIAKGRLRPAVQNHAHARIAKGGGLIALARKATRVSIETPQPVPPPSMAERAIDTATDVSRTVEEVTGALKVAVDRLSETIANAQRPGQPLARLRAVTREAPLRSLFVAFLLGVVMARRR